MRYGLPLPQRLQKFNELLLNKQANQISKFDVPTMGGSELHEVYQISIDLPKYRLDNTRTLALQEQYIFNNTKDEEFFNDVESDEIQEIQHGFLKSLLKSSDKDKDLLSYFSNHKQTDPLILTHDGFVISGNRRLCAFRELIGENSENFIKYKHFALIRVVILPNYDQAQIDQIEDCLEQQKDIKEPFSWVSRALGYRRRIQRYKYSDETLSSITGIKKAEIRILIDKLEIADRYLDSINKPKDYLKILDDDFAFERIYTCQMKDKGPQMKKMAFESLAFIALKNKDKFSDRMYKNIPIIQEAQGLIQSEIIDQFKPEKAQIENELSEYPEINGISNTSNQNFVVIKLLEKNENERKIVNIIIDKIEEFVAINKERKKKSSVLDRLAKANALLNEANIIKSHETDKTGVLNQIANLEIHIDSLKNWVKE